MQSWKGGSIADAGIGKESRGTFQGLLLERPEVVVGRLKREGTNHRASRGACVSAVLGMGTSRRSSKPPVIAGTNFNVFGACAVHESSRTKVNGLVRGSESMAW